MAPFKMDQYDMVYFIQPVSNMPVGVVEADGERRDDVEGVAIVRNPSRVVGKVDSERRRRFLLGVSERGEADRGARGTCIH